MKYTETDLLAFVEGHLSDHETAALLAAARADPELANSIELFKASMVPIDQAYKQNATPPVPDALRKRVQSLVAEHEGSEPTPVDAPRPSKKPTATGQRTAQYTQAALAACLVGGVCVGALLTTLYVKQTVQNSVQLDLNNPTQSTAQASLSSESSSESDAALPVSPASDHARLVQRIADYQSLYIENTVKIVASERVQEAHQLLESISERTQTRTAIPDFSEFGYEFARAQELGFEGQTLVQLVYRKPGSSPLAFCYMLGAKDERQATNVQPYHQLNSASWIQNNQHYVLLADEPDGVITDMVDAAVVAF